MLLTKTIRIDSLKSCEGRFGLSVQKGPVIYGSTEYRALWQVLLCKLLQVTLHIYI